MQRIWYALIYVAWLATVLAAPAKGDGEQRLYLRYCSACHGENGKGDGVVSGFMNPKPSDLTQLAKKAGGKFPLQTVMRAIDGRQTLRAHGNPDMPVWGEVFRDEATTSDYAETDVRGKIVLIAKYLESIQTK
jgi:mono/diheme cytochrome c family protein